MLNPAILACRPGWVLPSASCDLNFSSGIYWASGGGSLGNLLSTTRASIGYSRISDGTLVSFAANVPRITDLGLLVEEARTNVALYSRDLTNSVWTKSNITAALNQIGADGASNSASSITATSSNGTVLQSITLSSSARFQTAYVKRIAGSGSIYMTMDNGSTWTSISVTSSWSNVSIPTQTLANPTIGFKIAVSGDAIAVDFVQNENGTFATSPIATTSSSATRAADVISGPLSSWFNQSGGTVRVEFAYAPGAAVANSSPALVGFSPGSTTTDRFTVLLDNNASYAGLPRVDTRSNNVTASAGGNPADAVSIGSTSVVKVAARFGLNNLGISTNAGTVRTQTTAALPALSLTTVVIGAQYQTSSPTSAVYYKRLTYFRGQVPDSRLLALTQ